MGNRGPNIQRKGELKLKKHNIQHPPYGIFIFLYSISPPIEQSLGQRKETGHNTFTLLFAPLFIFFFPRCSARGGVCGNPTSPMSCPFYFARSAPANCLGAAISGYLSSSSTLNPTAATTTTTTSAAKKKTFDSLSFWVVVYPPLS